MELVQSRIVTNNVEGLAAFYAGLVGTSVALNEYYVEVPGRRDVGRFSKRRFTEYRERRRRGPGARNPGMRSSSTSWSTTSTRSTKRIDALGVEWIMPPTTQPWGNRSMIFRDPEGNLINVFSRGEGPAG